MRGKFRQIYHSRLPEVPRPSGAEREKVIICVGSIGLRKGQTYLVEAFSRIASKHPDWDLALVGRPADETLVGRIRDVVSKNKLQSRVQFAEHCSDAELTSRLNRSAIFAMPSLMEGLGLSLQEALVHGCACIGSGVGGIPDLIKDGDNGLLVEPGNVPQLAEGLERLMEHHELRSRLALRGPQSIEEKEMTAPKMVEKYDNLYQAALAEWTSLHPRAKVACSQPSGHASRN